MFQSPATRIAPSFQAMQSALQQNRHFSSEPSKKGASATKPRTHVSPEETVDENRDSEKQEDEKKEGENEEGEINPRTYNVSSSAIMIVLVILPSLGLTQRPYQVSRSPKSNLLLNEQDIE